MANRNRVKDHGAGEKLFARVPNALARDYELSNMARSVAMEVWSHEANWQQSMADIAKRLKTGSRQVSNAFGELEARGWLVREIVKVDSRGRPAIEVWHRNLTNEPFTARQVEVLQGTIAPEAMVTMTPEAMHSSETSSETTSEKNHRLRGDGCPESPQDSPRVEAHLSEANTVEDQTQGSGMKAAENIPTMTPGAMVTSASGTAARKPMPWEGMPFADSQVSA